MKANAAAFGWGWGLHQFTDGADHLDELLVVVAEAAFDFVEAVGQVGICGQEPPQTDEGPYDLDVHLHGPLAAEHAGEHGHALFGARERRETRIAVLSEPVRVCGRFTRRVSYAVSRNMKSAGNRPRLRFTA
jgi:hypothetical protein